MSDDAIENSQSPEDKAMNSARFQLRMDRMSVPAPPNLPMQRAAAPLALGEEYELIVNRPGGLL